MTSAFTALRSAALAIALVASAAGTAAAQTTNPAPAAYNPAVGANPFPIAEGYSWTYKDMRGNLHDIRCTSFAPNSGIATFHNLSGKNEFSEVRKTRDQFQQPIVEAREEGRRRNFALWGKLFASRYPWTWTGTDDVTLKGQRSSSWYRSAVEPAGTFLHPLVYDIAPAPGVADAGINQIVLEPGIGLLEQTFNTIAGPNAWELDSAKTAAGQVPAILYGVETKLTVTPSSFTYPGILPAGTGGYRPPNITAKLEARIRPGVNIKHTLTFNSSLRAELEIYDEDNNLVYSYLTGKPFAHQLAQIDLKPGQPFSFTFTDIPMPGAQMDFRARYRFKAFIYDQKAQQGQERFAAQELMTVMAGM